MSGTTDPTLYLVIDRGVPASSVTALRRAASDTSRAIEVVDVRTADPADAVPAETDAVLNLATSSAAVATEVALLRGGARSVHRSPRPWLVPAHPEELLQRAGVPVLRSELCPTTTRQQRHEAVERIGGLPVVVKVPGGENGVGVMLAPSWPALHALLDHLLATGPVPRLIRFLDRAEHWRVVVVGGVAVTGYRNDVRPDDFRSAPAEATSVPGPVGSMACDAADALLTEWAGVDVLVDEGGAAFVIEVNTPCSLAVPGVLDTAAVADALVAHLLPPG